MPATAARRDRADGGYIGLDEVLDREKEIRSALA
jgi:hypothetical protein